MQTVRKLGGTLCGAQISGPVTAQIGKIAKIRLLRDRTEHRAEFSHSLLDFCTSRNVCKEFDLTTLPNQR